MHDGSIDAVFFFLGLSRATVSDENGCELFAKVESCETNVDTVVAGGQKK